ncbi:phosphatidylglycerophosphatase A [Pseudooceanicola sp. CBS1P-1]|uniref:Phosphatidylglycerophosphatase A n=1 Tax=Pseudooceanicola albus TaxID=2692189 RepID=A0A6L7G2S5_9RHOB|nr:MULTISPECIES: phosphatidylglycerophosphatase A [Pseudooceanicola]MBT9383846.1 phosphatidylglycerophosphatase A [Pseudooceanicola endophyticus]MXN17700.1 phosphatidylglycerophosphatase A [Pseudooceanicola albus]
MKLSHLVATFAGVGHLKPAPGTWGSIAALPVAWVLSLIGGPLLLAIAAVALFFAGLWATRAETAGKANHDPSEVVVDEVVGQWIAFFPVVFGAWHVGFPLIDLWPGWVTALLAFRLFDIWKPWLVGRADRRDDAVGVMLDDVWAGIFAAVVVVAMAAFFHLVVMR